MTIAGLTRPRRHGHHSLCLVRPRGTPRTCGQAPGAGPVGRHCLLQVGRVAAPAGEGRRHGAGGDDRVGRAVHHPGDDAGLVQPPGLQQPVGPRASPMAMAHINLSREADAVLVAPASADFIAKLAQGTGRRTAWSDVPGPAGRTLRPAAGPRDEPRDVGPSRHPAQCAAGAQRWGGGVRPGPGRPGLRGNRRRPHARAPGSPARGDCLLPAQAAGRQAGADHRRPHLRAHRPGAWHHQPVQRQDGFCHCQGRPRGRGGGDAGRRAGAPGHAAGRAAGGCADGAGDVRRGAGRGHQARCLHCHRRGGRLAPGAAERTQDQEERQQGRPELRADREPRHPGRGGPPAAQRPTAPPLLRGFCRRKP